MSDLHALLWVIARGRPHALIEVRFREQGRMRQRFIPANHFGRIAATVASKAKGGDVFVGAAPRNAPNGGKRSVPVVHTLWADCDSADSIDRLATFEPGPRYVVATGSEGHAQAWWPLRHSVTPEGAERLNRRLAQALGADIVTCDASRVLRPPGTFNYKHEPPAPVRCIAQLPGFVDPGPIASMPGPDTRRPESEWQPRTDEADSLLDLLPEEYVTQLTGRPMGRDRKVQCPFHSGGKERTPSLHVYGTAARGWRCFGCNRGGSIYDFAGELWTLSTRGDEFKQLKARLREELCAG